MAARCAEVDVADDLVKAAYVFTRAELPSVGRAILVALGREAAPLDTPSRLQEAVMALIRSVGGRGEAVVRRSPAALLTPEYWQIELFGVDCGTRDHLMAAFGPVGDDAGRRRASILNAADGTVRVYPRLPTHDSVRCSVGRSRP